MTSVQTGSGPPRNRSGTTPPCTRVTTFDQPTLTAVNQALFKGDVTYDGHADLAVAGVGGLVDVDGRGGEAGVLAVVGLAVLLVLHLLVVASVLFAHLHYSIDIVGAYAITFALFALREAPVRAWLDGHVLPPGSPPRQRM